MINEKVLEEKLKYLVISESHGNYEIQEFGIDFEYTSWTKKDEISAYNVDIKFDYMLPIDSDSQVFGKDVQGACYGLGEILEKYGITKEGKLTTNEKHVVFPAMIWEIQFSADEKHIFNVSYKVLTND